MQVMCHVPISTSTHYFSSCAYEDRQGTVALSCDAFVLPLPLSCFKLVSERWTSTSQQNILRNKLHESAMLQSGRLQLHYVSVFRTGLPGRRCARIAWLKSVSSHAMPAPRYALVKETTPMPCSSPADVWLKEAPRGKQISPRPSCNPYAGTAEKRHSCRSIHDSQDS